MTRFAVLPGLDPFREGTAVPEFNRHFRIPAKHPGLALLSVILNAFSTFPYENVSKIIKNSRVTDDFAKIRRPEEILSDHLEFHLGGTCFSLTYMLDCILKHHGFHCYPISADMRYGEGIHCALVAVIDRGHYLIDPGYCITGPLPLHKKVPVHFRSPGNGIRLHFSPEGPIELYTFDQGGEKWRYRFRDEPLSYDRFLRNWLHSFTLNSMNALCLNKLEDGVMTYMHRHTLRRTDRGNVSKMDAGPNLHEVIQHHFSIDPRFVDEASAVLTAHEHGRRR